jgi:putative aldouronate transport system substrate-binding protein
MKKCVTFVLAFTVSLALLVPVVFAETPDTSKFVTLKMYLMGDGAPDAQVIWSEVNKMLKDDINAEVEVIFVPWSGRADKVRLLLSSGEEFDLIFASDWNLFKEQVQLGAYYPLDDLLPVYGQGLLANLPDAAWKVSSYKGEIFMVPYNSFEFDTHGLLYRLDWAKEFGFADGLKTVDDVERYLDMVKETKGIMPMNLGGTSEYMGFEMWRVEPGMRLYPKVEAAAGLWYYLDDPENLWFQVESEGFKNWIQRAKRWADKGFWSRSAMSKEVTSRTEFTNGNSGSTWVNPLQASDLFYQASAAFEGSEYDWWDPKSEYEVMRRRPLIGNGIAVSATAKNPERALMLLDLLHNDQRYNELTTFGIRGQHWDLDADGNLVMPEGVTAAESGYPWDRACPWGWREDKFYRMSPLQSKAIWDVTANNYKKWAENAVANPYDGFIFDQFPIEGELAALAEIATQYDEALRLGILDDPLTAYGEYMAKRKAAGSEKVRAEVEKQWKAFLETLK